MKAKIITVDLIDSLTAKYFLKTRSLGLERGLNNIPIEKNIESFYEKSCLVSQEL